MKTNELLKILENAIDYDTTSEFHLGYTAKEIHRKCLIHIKELDERIKKLGNTYSPYLGWGKGKDE